MKTPLNTSFTLTHSSLRSVGVDRFRLLLKGWGVKVLSLMVVVMVGVNVMGQVYYEDFGSNATVVIPYSSGTNATGNVIKNVNFTSPVWNQNLTSANFAGNTLGGMSATVGTSNYTITCTFSVAANYQFNPTSIGFDNRGTTGGPNALNVTISGTGGSTSKAFTPSRTAAFTTTSPTNFASTTQNLTGAITLTFAFTGGGSGGTERFDNLILNGSVTSIVASAPGAPTIGSATAGNTSATVAYTAPASNGGSAITTYTATSNPGGITGSLSQAGSGTITVNGLTNGATYTFTVTATNSAGTSAASSSSNSVTPALTYCTPSAIGSPTDGITNVSFNTMNNTSIATTGYTSYTSSQSTTVTQSSSYNLNVSVNTGGDYTNNQKVWIDWNQDGSFNSTAGTVGGLGEEYNLGAATNVTNGLSSLCPLSVTVPSGATLGTTRMRVSSKFNGYTTSCATNVDGEFEDYTIVVSAASTTPSINTSGTLTALSTTYGTASSNTTFSVSGTNMSEGISITPPAGFEVSTSSSFSSNVGSNSSPLVVGAVGTISSTTVYVRLAASTVVGTYSGNIVLSSSGTSSVNVATISSTVNAVSPTLTAAMSATVDAFFNVTFSDDATWRSAITSIKVDGSTLTNGFAVTAGQITFTPSASAPTSLLQSSGSKSIVVVANGYTNATVTQAIGFGAATKLGITTQPTAPASNGAVLSTQPVIAIQDQYGNTVTSDNSTLVTAVVSSGSWTIGGTLVKTAVSGVATFNDLTASSTSTVANATIGFTSSPTNTSAISNPPFAIPAPDYISLTGLGVATIENFNSLATSGTSSSLPQGWYFTEIGSNNNSFYTSGTGSANGGDTYSFGSSADRSFGTLLSNSLTSTIGAKIKNNTAQSISSILISYTGETWRVGTANRSDRLDFQYSTDATSFSTGTWTDFNNLDYSNTAGSSTANGSLLQSSAISSTISSLSITSGSTFWIRWVDSDASGSDDGMGIDDIAISGCNNLPSTSNLSISGASTIAGNGAVVTVTSSTLADGNYTVTYNVSGTNTVASTTATMTFASGTGTFTTSTLSSTGNSNLVNITSIAFTSVTGCPSSVSASSAAFNTVSTSVAYSNTQFTTARNITRGTTELPIYRFQVDVTNAAATLSSLGFTTPATAANGNSNYVNTDITNFKAFLTTSTTFSNATQLGSTSPSGKTQQNAGETLINFTSLATTLNVGTTYYIWLTADVLSTAVPGRTIIVNAPTIGITGAVSGANSATGTQTIISVATNYYLNTGGSLSTSSNYFTSPNGVGTTLSAAGLTYTSNDIILNIPVSVTNTSDFTLGNGSKIVVHNGGSLTVGASNTITGTIDVNDGGTLTVNNTSVLHTLGTLGYTSSTVIYNANGNQTVAVKPYANLTISGLGVKTIGAATVSGTLNLNNGTLDIGSSTFVINGPVSQSSGLIDADAGTLSFGNSVDMSLLSSIFSGDIYNLSKSSGAGVLTVNDNLNITNNLSTSASTGALVLASAKQLTVGGIITNNGTFTIENGATLVQTGTGANANSGNGTYNVKQAITGSGGTTPNGRFWYLGGALLDASSTALLSSAGSQLWQWNESNFNYALVPTGQQLAQGKSYVLRSGQNEIINFSGASLSNGTVNVTGLTRTGTTQTYRGCHLISNPYPSYLDWNAITKTNIGSTMYVRMAVGSTLDVMETYNSVGNIATNNSGTPLTQYIAPMQGFWVKVPTDGQTGSLTMDNSMRSHQPTGAGLRSTPQDFPAFLRFNMLDGQNKDQVILLMSPDASMSLDAFDSEKMSSSGYAQFYSTVNAKKLVINGMKNVKAKTSVPLTLVMPTSKSYTLHAEEFNIEDGLILLEDKQEGVIQDLTINPTYSFFGNAGTNATRFVVHFQLATAPVLVGGPQELESLGSDELMSDNIQIVSNNQGTVIIRLDEGFKPEGNIRIFDASGRLVEQTDFKDQETTVQLNEQAGMYFVEVSAGKLMVKKKIVIE